MAYNKKYALDQADERKYEENKTWYVELPWQLLGTVHPPEIERSENTFLKEKDRDVNKRGNPTGATRNAEMNDNFRNKFLFTSFDIR